MEIVGGYRLVRKLGAGPRADVCLGHAGTGEEPRVAALKLYRPETPESSIDTEIEALGRAGSRHLLSLRDLATDRGGRPCLILERLVPGSLAGVLSERDHLLPGEAVTILAPLTLAVGELHRVGVAHGAIRVSNVLFDESGAPVLAAFGSATLIGPFPASAQAASLTAAQLSEEAAVRQDLAGLALVCRTVLERTQGLDSRRGAELRDALERPVADARRVPHEWAELLFDLDEPLPLGNRAQQPMPGGRPAVGPFGAAVLRPLAPALQPEPTESEAPSGTRRAVWRSAAHRARLWERVRSGFSGLRQAVLRLYRPILLAGAAGIVLAVLGLTLIPSAQPPTTRAGPGSTGEAARPVAGWTVSRQVADAIGSDDPVAAARVLLQERRSCLEHRSVPCLRLIDQADSAVLENDRHLVRSSVRETGPEQLLFPIEAATLLERMGDSALVAITLPQPHGSSDGAPAAERPTAEPEAPRSPAVLVVRTDQGWQLRDLLVD